MNERAPGEVDVPAPPGDRAGLVSRFGPDALIVCSFLLFAIAHHQGRTMGVTPFPLLEGDAANIAGFAAALDHPEAFEGDFLLSRPQDFAFYAALQVPLTRWLASLVGRYDAATTLLLWLHVFVQMVGFYILGRTVFGHRLLAWVFAYVTALPVNLYIEGWGVFGDVIPRLTFQALLPFLLALSFRWRNQPRRWPWIMWLCGELVYVHPVSAPAWVLGLWAGFLAFYPSAWGWKRRIWTALGLGGLFLLVTAPFVLHYLTFHAHGTPHDGVDYSLVYQIMTFRLQPAYLDIPLATGTILGRLFKTRNLYLPLWAALSAVLLPVLRGCDRRGILLVCLWMLGISLSAIPLPWAEQAYCRAHRMLPVEIDLVRGLRYLIPAMLLLGFLPFSVLAGGWPVPSVTGAGRWRRRGAWIAVGVVAILWTKHHEPECVWRGLRAWTRGEAVVADPASAEEAAAIFAVRDRTPHGSRIMSAVLPLAVRYLAMRPVVYAYKDGGALAYSDYPHLIEWYARAVESGRWQDRPAGESKVATFLDLARRWDADYALLDLPVDPPLADRLGAEVVWSGASHALLRLRR